MSKNKTKNKNKNKFKYIFLSLGILIMSIITIILYLIYFEGFYIRFKSYDIQKQYGRFLIECNDDFIDKMVKFDELVQMDKIYSDYTEQEKQYISDLVVSENNTLKWLKETEPNKKENFDYEEIYEDLLKSYALYIQGQLLKAEYIYQTEDGVSDEKLALGDNVSNMVGNYIIEYDQLINDIRNTSYEMKYTVIDGMDINTGDLEQIPVEYDDDGNIIIDEDKEYLYTPDNTTTKPTENVKEN